MQDQKTTDQIAGVENAVVIIIAIVKVVDLEFWDPHL